MSEEKNGSAAPAEKPVDDGLDTILHELNQLECGGVERVVATIARYDTKHRHKVISYLDGPMRQEFEALGVEVHVPAPGDSTDIPAQLVHAHTGGGPSVIAQQMGSMFPIIETIHSPVKSAVRRDQVMRKVGVSKAVCALNPESRLIYNGIDFKRLEDPASRAAARKALGVRPDSLVIGRIGRVAPDKYVEEFLLACKELQKDTDCDVVIAGQESSKKGYLGRIKLMAECLGIRNVKFPGYMNPKDCLPAFDVFLYPSKDEGFGLVFAEALHFGIPVVTYNTPLTQELMAGFATLTGPTAENLAQGVRVTIQPAVRDYFQERGPVEVQQRFDGERMAEEYSALYEEVIAECQERTLTSLAPSATA